ncbi:MAG: PQQ-binding-like beta-propeller repeat protein [Methanothrix sp.]|nr:MULTISPECIES: PQQ-binding-like beta-propeller repeat protein [Methanothrix]MBC7079065.1 PQQ-binding-like beta-propeller repeat protein [Methanothrix sp.]NPU87221.1 PQQ-binding-like beta-propeller repeat protein [Methanothrix sp.]
MMRVHATLHMKDIYTILKGNSSIYLITLIMVFAIFTVLCNVGISDWPQYQQDGFNSGVTSERFPEYPVILWSADIQRVDVTPVICDGAVYVIAGNGTLYAFDAGTGEAIWASHLDGWVFQTSTPACGGKKVFAATDSGNLAAVDRLTGIKLWNYSLTDKRFEAPLTYDGLRLYIGEGSAYGTSEKKFFCIFDNGTECWNYTSETKGYQWCGSCSIGNYVVVGQNDGIILSLNRVNGEVADALSLNDSTRLSFSQNNPGRIRAPVTCKDGWIYTTSEITANEGYVWKIAFDKETGRFEDRGWSVPIGFSTSTPAIFADRVYLGVGEHGHPGALVCINDTSGDMIWTYPVEAGVKASPAISTAYDKPRIIFNTAQIDGSVYCIEDSGDRGELLWKFDPPDNGYILGGVAVYKGRLYFGTEGDQHYGKLYCLGDDEWSQFHHDPQHTGLSRSKAPRDNRTAWISEDIRAQPGSSVSVASGMVFVNCVDRLVCLDQISGRVLWSHPFKSAGDYAFGFTPVYHDGKVFFTSDRTYCLNASDGEEVWSYTPPTGRFAIDGSPAIAEGKIFVSDWDGHHYYCLEEETGKEIWNFTVEGNAQSTPAIDLNRLVFGSWEWGLGGRIYCVHLNNGTEIWNLSTENSPCGSATINDGVVYMPTYNFDGDGDLLALSLVNGSILWRAEISPTDSTPAFADDRVYVCGGCEGFSKLHTYCFDAKTGELIWKTPSELEIGDWRCSPAYADGLVFVGRPDFMEYDGIFALNATTGEIVWSYPAGGSSPAVACGMVFTIGNGRVYAFGDSKATG